LWLRLILVLGDAIDFDFVAVAAGGEQQHRHQNRQQPGVFWEPATGDGLAFFNRTSFHNR
jgi:hypothetical protein